MGKNRKFLKIDNIFAFYVKNDPWTWSVIFKLVQFKNSLFPLKRHFECMEKLRCILGWQKWNFADKRFAPCCRVWKVLSCVGAAQNF